MGNTHTKNQGGCVQRAKIGIADFTLSEIDALIDKEFSIADEKRRKRGDITINDLMTRKGLTYYVARGLLEKKVKNEGWSKRAIIEKDKKPCLAYYKKHE